jgi:hypothetical protein
METFGVKSLSEKYALYSIITKFKAGENTNDQRHLNGQQAKRTLDVVAAIASDPVLPACEFGQIKRTSPQNRKSSTSRHEIYIFVGHFCPLDPDPDQQQCGSESGSATLEKLVLLCHLERV